MATIKLRRGTSQQWAAKNPILEAGEPGFETDTRMYKVGDGFTRWNDLTYAASSGSSDDSAVMAALNAHIASLTPHPVYDDGPSLVLLYQNAKV